MKQHSVKVPRLYKVSAQVAKEVSEGVGSIKTLVYEKQKKHPNIKAIYALVATLFQKTDELEILLKRSQLLVKEPKFDAWLAKILIVELIWGKKKLPGQSKPENTVRAYEQIFKAHLSDELSGEIQTEENNGKPRYVRVNTLLSSFSEAVDGFRDDGWALIKFLDKADYKGYLEKITSLNNEEFMIDIHVPNLLVFPPRTQFYNHPAYKNGSILLQDKASCLPVHILAPPEGSTILDMCAAPGMKTTHLAAVLNDKGTVYATERNPRRFETLSKIVEMSGAKCIKSFNKDILDCTKEDFPGVEYILVDPSCSGTGMSERPQDTELTQSRMTSLTGFQIKILRHALTKFPDAKKVVYSTCSILPEENEDVVRQVLETNYNFKLVPANQFVGDNWLNFGSSEYGDIGKFCLYAKPKEDYTNGFFVAVFERLNEGEENQFFNTRIFNFKKHVQANEKWKEKKQKKFDNHKENELSESKEKKHEREYSDHNVGMTKDENHENTLADEKKNKKKRKLEKKEEDLEDVTHFQSQNPKKKKDKKEEVMELESFENRKKNNKKAKKFDELENVEDEAIKKKKNTEIKCEDYNENSIENDVITEDVTNFQNRSFKKKKNKKEAKGLESVENEKKKNKNSKEIEELESVEDKGMKKKKKKIKINHEDYTENSIENDDIIEDVTNSQNKRPKKKKNKKEGLEELRSVDDKGAKKKKTK